MIVSIDIKAIEPLADGTTFGEVGPYERVIGVARGEVDPKAPGKDEKCGGETPLEQSRQCYVNV